MEKDVFWPTLKPAAWFVYEEICSQERLLISWSTGQLYTQLTFSWLCEILAESPLKPLALYTQRLNWRFSFIQVMV